MDIHRVCHLLKFQRITTWQHIGTKTLANGLSGQSGEGFSLDGPLGFRLRCRGPLLRSRITRNPDDHYTQRATVPETNGPRTALFVSRLQEQPIQAPSCPLERGASGRLKNMKLPQNTSPSTTHTIKTGMTRRICTVAVSVPGPDRGETRPISESNQRLERQGQIGETGRRRGLDRQDDRRAAPRILPARATIVTRDLRV